MIFKKIKHPQQLMCSDWGPEIYSRLRIQEEECLVTSPHRWKDPLHSKNGWEGVWKSESSRGNCTAFNWSVAPESMDFYWLNDKFAVRKCHSSQDAINKAFLVITLQEIKYHSTNAIAMCKLLLPAPVTLVPITQKETLSKGPSCWE